MTEQPTPAARMIPSHAHYSRSRPTIEAVLSAAAEIFVEKGFEPASIADLVERSGVSVGSIYHHFGGKAEVFGALYDEYYHRMRARTEVRSQSARDAGVADLLEIYLAGARAYLEGCWHERGLTYLFHGGEGPPWLWNLRQKRVTSWTRTNMELLGSVSQPHGGSLAHAVTALVAACALELTEVYSADAAHGLIDFYLELISSVASPYVSGDAHPAV